MKLLIVFLDASVLLSGLISSTGGSGKLLKAGEQKKLKLVVTEKIVHEAVNKFGKVNVQHKTFENLLSSRTIRIVHTPREEKIAKFRSIIDDPDDAHVLAGAVYSRATVLVSLDKSHILVSKIRKALRPIKILSPKEFWTWLKKHEKHR